MGSMFSQNGRLSVPSIRVDKKTGLAEKTRESYVLKEAYCPNGCSVLNEAYPINGHAGLHIKFRRGGMEGEFILSAVEGDFDKIILSGSLAENLKDDLFCPHCDAMFEKLTSCNCQPGADMIVVGMTDKLDFNNAVTFCNVTGCENGALVKSGQVLRHIRLV